MFLNCSGSSEIKVYLEKNGHLTAIGLKKWDASSVVRILRNPFYSGTIVYRKSFIPDYLEQKAKINKGEVEQIVIEGKHQPIVTKEEFKIVQKILESHSVARQEKRGHGCASPIIVEWKLKLMADMIFDIIWNNKKSIIEIANNIIEKTIQNDSLNQFMDEEIMECESNITLNKNKLDRIVDMYCANIIINILKIIVKRNNT